MDVLIVEDDPDLAKVVANYLSCHGHTTHVAESVEVASSYISKNCKCLVLLDLNLKNESGYTLLQKIRNAANHQPVIILTAKDMTSEKIKALNMGADDYITKPFILDELNARIKTVYRRAYGETGHTFQFKDIQILIESKICRKGSRHVLLTKFEWEIISHLISNPNRTFTKHQLEKLLHHNSNDLSSNSVEVHISNIRKKLDPQLIKTQRGLGYTFEK